MIQTPGDVVRDAFRGKSVVPKGTADAVLSRLFPETRSKVPYDEERRKAVYYILDTVGAFNLGQQESDHVQGVDDAAEGDSSQRGPDDARAQVVSA